MARAYLIDIGFEIAHDALDDLAAKPVVRTERIALALGQGAAGDALHIGENADFVLDVALL